MNLRILQVMAGAEHGGAELFFERLCTALHRAGVQQHIVMRAAPDREERMREAGMMPVTLPFGGRLDFITGMRLRKEISRFKPDVVLTWMSRATRFTPKGDYVLAARLGGFYDIKYYRHCDYVVCNTKDICNHMVTSGFDSDRVVELPNFVPVDPLPPVSRRSLYTPENVPVILSLGRLHENKGFDTLIRALPQIPEAYLWLAGEGPLRNDLETLAQNLSVKPRVRFLGWRNDTAALYGAANVVVFPSRHEPLGNVILETWSQCRALVATEAQGPLRLITNEENGLLVPIDDPRALATAIQRVIGDPTLRNSLAENGWNTFKSTYTEEKVVSAYRAFFERTVEERRGGAKAATATQSLGTATGQQPNADPESVDETGPEVPPPLESEPAAPVKSAV